MAAVAALAIDSAMLRVLYVDHEWDLAVRGSLLMVNLLAWGSYRLASRRDRDIPFLAGFVAAGLVATLVYFDACILYHNPISAYHRWVLAPIGYTSSGLFVYAPRLGMDSGVTVRTRLIDLALAPLVVGMISLPLVSIALAGGILARRLGLGGRRDRPRGRLAAGGPDPPPWSDREP